VVPADKFCDHFSPVITGIIQNNIDETQWLLTHASLNQAIVDWALIISASQPYASFCMLQLVPLLKIQPSAAK
jgi:hypothetical protein